MTPSPQWQSTDDHAPAAGAGGQQWQSTDDHAPGDKPSIGGFLSNTLSSAGKFVGDMAGPLLHPGDTLEGVKNLFEGMSEKTGQPAVAGQSHGENVNALVKMYSDRYGSFDKFRQTLYNDPVGVLSDVAALASAGGGVAKGVELGADALKADAVANAAAKVGKVASTVSDVANPLSLAGKAADVTGLSKVADNFGDWTSQKLRKLSLKGGYTVNADPLAVQAAARTMGEEKIPLSDAGVQKITQAVEDLQQAKQAREAASPAMVNPESVAQRLDVLAQGSAGASQVNPQKDIADINKVKANFLASNPGPIPVARAEALKSGTYANNKYGPSPPPQLAATAKAEKGLAAGLKEEIENQLPEIKELNAQQQKFINLQGMLEQAVHKHSNAGSLFGGGPTAALNTIKNIGIGAGAVAGAGHLAGPVVGSVAGAAAVAATVLSDPAMKARLAAAIDWGRANAAKAGKPLVTTGNGISRVGAFIDSLQPQPQQ